MLKKQILLTLCFLTSMFWQSQNIDVLYSLEMKPNLNDSTYIEKDTFTLNIRGNSSFFYSNSYFKFISNMQQGMKDKVDINTISSNYMIKKNTNSVDYIVKFENEFIQYEAKELPKWKLIPEYKKISTFKCQKAITHFKGRDYIAWFTEEYAISEGPHKFKNLPGLVLELSSKDGDYHFMLIEIKKGTSDIPEIPSIPIKSRKKYIYLLKKYKDNPSYRMKQKDASNSFEYKSYVNGVEVNKTEKYRLYNEFIWKFTRTHNNPIEKDDIWIR